MRVSPRPMRSTTTNVSDGACTVSTTVALWLLTRGLRADGLRRASANILASVQGGQAGVSRAPVQCCAKFGMVHEHALGVVKRGLRLLGIDSHSPAAAGTRTAPTRSNGGRRARSFKSARRQAADNSGECWTGGQGRAIPRRQNSCTLESHLESPANGIDEAENERRSGE